MQLAARAVFWLAAEGFGCAVATKAVSPRRRRCWPAGRHTSWAAYEITACRLPNSDKISFARGHRRQRAPAGSVRAAAAEPLVPEFCEPAERRSRRLWPASYPAGVVKGVPDCGAKQLRFLWTQHRKMGARLARLAGAVDGMGDMLGDGDRCVA